MHELGIGLAVGEGTGPELAAVFEEAVAALAPALGLTARVVRSPHLYRTFTALVAGSPTTREVEAICDTDARVYEDFLRELHAAGCRVVFRTAFNAQPLYELRERLTCVKIEVLPLAGGELMMVRDQAQGFYAGSNLRDGDEDVVRRTCVLSRAVTHRILDFARAEATRRWGAIDHIVMAYKFHLLDQRFAAWVADYARAHGVEVRVVQPDTMNRSLARGLLRGRVLAIGANEWGDIMHADLMARAGLGAHDERCSRNVYLDPAIAGMEELQTVHGSADDLAGRDRVNPSATLRALARILEEHGGRPGVVERMDAALEAAAACGAVTPDIGGTAGTREMALSVVQTFLAGGPAVSTPMVDRAAEALVVVDVQNDFCARDGRFARLGLVDPEATAAFAFRLRRLVAEARERGVEVIFARTFADEHLLPANVVERNRRTGRAGYLRSSEWGARFFSVAPVVGEKVVTKLGYDAFLGTDLEEHLRAAGVERVAIAGVFTELCVDALARGAYQRGLRVTVVSDGTLPLERDQAEVTSFMARYYDATIADIDAVTRGWSSPGAEGEPTAARAAGEA